MKFILRFLVIILIAFTLYGCSNEDSAVFTATVLENNQDLLVEPVKDTNEYKSSDKIVVHTNEAIITNSKNEEIAVSDIAQGQTVEITYNGMIAESYPAQIWADKIKLIE